MPFPKELRVERQLSSSILIAWSAPDGIPAGQVQSYNVFTDGQFMLSVKGNDRTKALLEKVNSTQVKCFIKMIGKKYLF